MHKTFFFVLGYQAVCWQPKQPNQVGSLEFWGQSTVPLLRSSLVQEEWAGLRFLKWESPIISKH